jgi:hypothetical protein
VAQAHEDFLSLLSRVASVGQNSLCQLNAKWLDWFFFLDGRSSDIMGQFGRRCSTTLCLRPLRS